MRTPLAVPLLTTTVLLGGSLLARVPGPATQASTFTFAAAGDFSLGSSFQATAAAVQAHAPAFLVTLGDLSYTGGGEKAWCQYWSDLGFTNLLLLAGNHDTGESLGGNIDQYLKHCGNPFSTNVVGTYTRQYYLDYPVAAPLARIILVTPGIGGDTGGLDTDYREGSAGFKFTSSAIDDARARGIKWIFVGMHKNYVSTMEKKNEVSVDNGQTFFTMLLNKKVDVILQAHEHGYERTKQVTTSPSCPTLPFKTFQSTCVVDSDDTLVKGAGTVIQVIGTGGKDMRNLEPGKPVYKYFVERFAYKDVEAFGFGSFAVTPTRLTFTYVRSKGANFADSFVIAETTSPEPAAPQTATLER
jgi:hypothetical protein